MRDKRKTERSHKYLLQQEAVTDFCLYSSAHLIHNFPFCIDLCRFLCYSDSPVICQPSHQTRALIQRASFSCLPVLRRQVVGPLGLFQICQSHTLQDNQTASYLSTVGDDSPKARAPLAFTVLPVLTCGSVWHGETWLSSETLPLHLWQGSDTNGFWQKIWGHKATWNNRKNSHGLYIWQKELICVLGELIKITDYISQARLLYIYIIYIYKLLSVSKLLDFLCYNFRWSKVNIQYICN